MKEVKHYLLVIIVLATLSLSSCTEQEQESALVTGNQEITKEENNNITEESEESIERNETLSEKEVYPNNKYFGIIDGEQYINKYYGFHMFLPDSWTAYSNENLYSALGYELEDNLDVNLDEEDGFYFFDFLDEDGISEVMGMVNRIDPDIYSTPEEYVEFNYSIYVSDDTEGSEIYNQTINGIEYYGFHIIDRGEDDNMIIKMLVTEMNGDLIEFSAIYFESDEDIVNQILNSITVI